MRTTPGSSRTFWSASLSLAGAALILLGSAVPSAATVHFGSGVRIGGHDFSHQTYDRHHRAIIHLYDQPVRGQGCVTRHDGRGGTLKTCRLQTIRH